MHPRGLLSGKTSAILRVSLLDSPLFPVALNAGFSRSFSFPSSPRHSNAAATLQLPRSRRTTHRDELRRRMRGESQATRIVLGRSALPLSIARVVFRYSSRSAKVYGSNRLLSRSLARSSSSLRLVTRPFDGATFEQEVIRLFREPWNARAFPRARLSRDPRTPTSATPLIANSRRRSHARCSLSPLLALARTRTVRRVIPR